MKLVKTLSLEVMEPLKQDVKGFHQGGVLTLVIGLVKVCQGHGHKSNDKVKSLFSSSPCQSKGSVSTPAPKRGASKKSDGKVQTKLCFK